MFVLLCPLKLCTETMYGVWGAMVYCSTVMERYDLLKNVCGMKVCMVKRSCDVTVSPLPVVTGVYKFAT